MNYIDIKTKYDLFRMLKTSNQYMSYVLYKQRPENLYHTFTIPKKNGDDRIINAPLENLKDIQKELSEILWKRQKEIWEYKKIDPITTAPHAFIKNKNIISNAKNHVNKKFIVNLDLYDFFNSFHFGRVLGFFKKNKYFKVPYEVALIIAQLTCYDGHLPQGAPTSPIITNLICNRLDIEILKLIKKYHLYYTRYADDLTFSTNDKHFFHQYADFLKEICICIENFGLKINPNKTRIQFKDARQEVTGLIVNKKINVKREYYKYTRAMAYNFYKKREIILLNKEKGTVQQLEGRFTYINQIDKYNNICNSSNNKKMNAHEKEYKKFLFYKNFYYGKPLIVTEGITDIIYLKAALKNLYHIYPYLIEKNNKFNFRVKFLNRTKRLKYFLNISEYGADAFSNIFALYKNYDDYFLKKLKSEPQKQVFLLFDQELNDKEKPISKFINIIYGNINDKKEKQKKIDDLKQILNQNYISHIRNNLYIATYKLELIEKEIEIEDLFDKKTLSHEIDGKTFNKNKKTFDPKKHYEKVEFANYIATNYDNIDFSRFKPTLDAINKKVKEYSSI